MTKNTSDQDTLSHSMVGGRLRRYAKVTSAMGGLAARLAGEKYLGIKIDREQHASDLRAALGGLKGPLMKVAQILATIPDALPQEYVNELSHLQADAPSMGWLFVKRRMKAELGDSWNDQFKSFDKQASAAASFFSGISATMHSVVSTMPAIEAAFCKPERVTLAGSTMPAASMSTYSPLAAL